MLISEREINERSIEDYAAVVSERSQSISSSQIPGSIIKYYINLCRRLSQTFCDLRDSAQAPLQPLESIDCSPKDFEFVQEQLAFIADAVRRPDFRRLPGLAGGTLTRHPRIIGVSLGIAAHTDYRSDRRFIEQFIRAYQRSTPLTDCELELFPIALRLVIVDRLLILVQEGIAACKPTETFDWAGAGKSGVFGKRRPLEYFIAKLRSDDNPGSDNTDIISAKRLIDSLRVISDIDWNELSESVSLLDPVLNRDPAGIYTLMDAETRGQYRRIIHDLAARSALTELDTARNVIELASEAHSPSSDSDRTSHIGYYLLAEGRPALERRIDYQQTIYERIVSVMRRHPLMSHLILLSLLASIMIVPSLSYAFSKEISVPSLLWLLMILAVSSVTFASVLLRKIPLSSPSILPKVDYSSGIPEAAQTIVVIPAILTSKTVINELLEALENHYLANQDRHVYFALLTDWPDASAESIPDDDVLYAEALRGIEHLNLRYQCDGRKLFYMFHRRRVWNERQGKWMGWERKRGKLREFNRLLRGAADTSFINNISEHHFLSRTRYVITLDMDNELLRDAARRLVGTISHPLNKAAICAQTRRLKSGYGIIQPGIIPSHPKVPRRNLPSIIAGNADISYSPEPGYDLYQFLYGEGLYVGKAIYEVDVFEQAMGNQFPVDMILSHDVIEGLYARTGLASDIAIAEPDEPHFYSTVKRMHRWVRGDWQLLPMLAPTIIDQDGNKQRNRLTPSARWRLAERIMAPLSEPMATIWLVSSWTILPGSPAIWMMIVLMMMLLLLSPIFFNPRMWRPKGEVMIRSYGQVASFRLKRLGSVVRMMIFQSIIFITCFVYDSTVIIDAITRTLYRLTISRRNLLDWTTAAQTRAENENTRRAVLRLTWPICVIVAVCFAGILLYRPQAIFPASTCLVLWGISPLVIYYNARRMDILGAFIRAKTADDLRFKAHQYWQMIVREDSSVRRPRPMRQARRIIWSMAANRLGVLGIFELADRIDELLSTLERDQDAAGRLHETDGDGIIGDSSMMFAKIESGNPAGHFTGYQGAIRDLLRQPIFGERERNGLRDLLQIIRREAQDAAFRRSGPQRKNMRRRRLQNSPDGSGATFTEIINDIDAALLWMRSAEADVDKFSHWNSALETLQVMSGEIRKKAQKAESEGCGAELIFWTDTLLGQIAGLKRQIAQAAPWLYAYSAGPGNVLSLCDCANQVRLRSILESLDKIPSPATAGARMRGAICDLIEINRYISANRSLCNHDHPAMPESLNRLVLDVKTGVNHNENLCKTMENNIIRGAAAFKKADYLALFDGEYYREVKLMKMMNQPQQSQ